MVKEAKIPFRLELLRRLHHIHCQKTDLQDQLDRGPRQIKAGEALVHKAQQALDAAKENLKQARLASDDKQLQLKSREEGISNLKTKLNTAASNREFDLLKEQIAADEQANLVLSDEILEGLEHIDDLTVQVKDAEKHLQQQTAESEKRAQETKARMLQVEEELVLVNERLETAEKEIPAAAKADYVRLVNQRGDEALAPIDDDSCGGCYQTLTANLVNHVRLETLVRCPNCNAMLYLT